MKKTSFALFALVYVVAGHQSAPATIPSPTSGNIVVATAENLEKINEASEGKTLILNFWAPWCPPCKAMTPVLKKMAAENPDVVVARVDIQGQPDLASKYGITSIPVTYVMRDRQVLEKFSGFATEDELMKHCCTE